MFTEEVSVRNIIYVINEYDRFEVWPKKQEPRTRKDDLEDELKTLDTVRDVFQGRKEARKWIMIQSFSFVRHISRWIFCYSYSVRKKFFFDHAEMTLMWCLVFFKNRFWQSFNIGFMKRRFNWAFFFLLIYARDYK